MVRRIVFMLACVFLLGQVVSAEIEIVHMRYAGHGQVWDDYVRERASAFEALHDGVRITFITAPGPRQMVESVVTMHAARVQLDVMEFNNRDGGPLVHTGIFLDYAPYINQDPGLTLDDFLPGALTTSMTQDGVVWSFPIDVYPMGVTLYWTDWFDEAGIPTPREQGDAWTWESAIDTAQRISVDSNGDGRNDRWGATQASRWWEQGTAVTQAGGWFFDDVRVPTRSQLLSSEVEDGLTYILSYVERGIIGGGWHLRTAAMDWTHGPGFWNVAPDDVRDLWDIWYAPMGPANNAGALVANGFQISSGSPNPEWAYEWVKFLAGSEEDALRFASATSRIPALRDAALAYGQAANIPQEKALIFMEAASHPMTRSTNDLQTPNAAELRTLLVNGFQPVSTRQIPLRSWLETTHGHFDVLIQEAWNEQDQSFR